MESSKQLSLDEGFYEFKDTHVLNRISRVGVLVSKMKKHNMLTPEDYQEILGNLTKWNMKSNRLMLYKIED